MSDGLRRLVRRWHQRALGRGRQMTHAELVTRLLDEHGAGFSGPGGDAPVRVETGAGVSTLAFAQAAGRLRAITYSCDCSEDKVAALKADAGVSLASVNFLIGDSLTSLAHIADRHERIDFALLDSAPSAMHTFREFLLLEPRLRPGGWVLIDNAVLPGRRHALSPARKGRVVVPYLLASSVWEVFEYPFAGDSMVAARRHAEPVYADPAYELEGYVDPWPEYFARHLGSDS